MVTHTTKMQNIMIMKPRVPICNRLGWQEHCSIFAAGKKSFSNFHYRKKEANNRPYVVKMGERRPPEAELGK